MGKGTRRPRGPTTRRGELGPDRHQVLIALRGRPVGRTRLRRFSAAPTNSRRGGDTAPSYDSSVRRRTPRVHRNRRGTRTVVEGRASIVTSPGGTAAPGSWIHHVGVLNADRVLAPPATACAAAGGGVCWAVLVGPSASSAFSTPTGQGLGRLPAAPPRRALRGFHHVGVLNVDRVLGATPPASRERPTAPRGATPPRLKRDATAPRVDPHEDSDLSFFIISLTLAGVQEFSLSSLSQ